MDGYRARDLDRFVALVEDALVDLPDDLVERAQRLDTRVLDVPGVEKGDVVALAAVVSGRLEVYRRPIEARASSIDELKDLVYAAIVDALDGAV